MKKKFKINKCYNIIKKLKACFECHNLIKQKLNKINKLNIKKNYTNLKKIKFGLKYNINMKRILNKIKNKYIIEISKYLKFLPKFLKKYKIC